MRPWEFCAYQQTRSLFSSPPPPCLLLYSFSSLLHLLPVVHLRLMILSSDCGNYRCPAAAMHYARQTHKALKGARPDCCSLASWCMLWGAESRTGDNGWIVSRVSGTAADNLYVKKETWTTWCDLLLFSRGEDGCRWSPLLQRFDARPSSLSCVNLKMVARSVGYTKGVNSDFVSLHWFVMQN